MKTTICSSLLLCTAVLFSCNNTIEHNNSSIIENELEKDSMSHFTVTDTLKKSYEITENRENLQKIEKKYGEQWGFCECVVANDSIDKAVKKIDDFESPQAEKLLERFDYVAQKCQAFLGMDSNRTPEERARHEKKVKKCLKNSK